MPSEYQDSEEEPISNKVFSLNGKRRGDEDEAVTAVEVKGKSWKNKRTQREQQQKTCINIEENEEISTREKTQQSSRVTQKQTSAKVTEDVLNGRVVTYPTSKTSKNMVKPI